MSDIICNVQGCPNNNGKFCKKKFLKINQNAMCSQVWRDDGQQNIGWQQREDIQATQNCISWNTIKEEENEE